VEIYCIFNSSRDYNAYAIFYTQFNMCPVKQVNVYTELQFMTC